MCVGLLETFHITRHFLGLDSCVLCAAQYTSKTLNLDRSTLFHALRKVVKTHPALGVGVIGEASGAPSFTRLKVIDLSAVVEFLDSDDLESVFEAQMLRPFDTTLDLPLWRVIVLKNDIVCFAWHHSIGDGMSGLSFHRTLLSSLRAYEEVDRASTDSDTTCITLPPMTQLVPPIEKVTNVSPSWGKLFRVIYELYAPTPWTRGASAWTGNPVKSHDSVSLKTRVKLINFNPEEVSAFINLCRAHNTTFTAAFHALCISELSRLIMTDHSTTPFKTISSSVPFSLREIAGTSQDVFCEHLSTLNSYPRVQPDFSWAEAADFGAELRRCQLKGGEDIGMLRYLFGQYVSFFKGKLGKKRQGGLEISNLGRFHDEAGDKDWSIGRMAFVQCDAVVGAALKMNIVGDRAGGVTVGVTWGEGSVADSFAELFVSAIRDAFGRMIM